MNNNGKHNTYGDHDDYEYEGFFNKNNPEFKKEIKNIFGDMIQNFKKKAKEEALRNDILLSQMAAYEISRGGQLTYPISKNGFIDFKLQNKINKKFAEFKRLVMSGRFTVEELEDIVYSAYGIVKENEDIGEELEEIINKGEIEER